MRKLSFREKCVNTLLVLLAVIVCIAQLGWVASIYFYPAFFWTSLILLVVLMVCGVTIDVIVNSSYENWGMGAVFYIMLPGIMTYLTIFTVLHIGKWVHVINLDIGWVTLSIVGVASAILAAVGGTTYMAIENRRYRHWYKSVGVTNTCDE